MTMMLAVLAALVASTWLTRRICDPASMLHVLDHPNERSLHTRPVPRTGGIAILAGLLGGVLVLMWRDGTTSRPLWLVAVAVLIAVLSFIDDRGSLSVRARLLGHFACAGLLVAGGFHLSQLSWPGGEWPWPRSLAIAFAVAYLVWMVNLYNFMDGMDGFAGGMAVIGFGTLALLGALSGNPSFVAINVVIAASAGGFLAFNFPPARIFMGDSGSATLGLLAGGLTLWGARDGVFPFWAGLLVFAPFIVDASVTLVRRLARRERVWEPHRTHYYQRLVQLGWGHRKTVVAEYGLMLACGASALLATRLSDSGQWLLIVVWCVVYAGLMIGVSRLEKASSS